MSNSEKDLSLIERYFKHELELDEVITFETKYATNQVFRNHTENYKILREVANEATVTSEKEIINEEEEPITTSAKRRFIIPRLALKVASVLLIVSLFTFWTANNFSDQAIANQFVTDGVSDYSKNGPSDLFIKSINRNTSIDYFSSYLISSVDSFNYGRIVANVGNYELAKQLIFPLKEKEQSPLQTLDQQLELDWYYIIIKLSLEGKEAVKKDLDDYIAGLEESNRFPKARERAERLRQKLNSSLHWYADLFT